MPYDKLVLGTGASPILLPVPGSDLEGVFILRFLRHAEAIREFLTARKPKKLAFIGAGFIGLETAILLRQADADREITIFELLDYPLCTMLDQELGDRVAEFLRSKNIELRMGVSQAEFIGRNGLVTGVKLNSGEVVEVDMVFMNVGARPNVDLSREAGLEIGQYGV